MGKLHLVHEVSLQLRRDCCQDRAYKSQVRVGTFSMSTANAMAREGKHKKSTGICRFHAMKLLIRPLPSRLVMPLLIILPSLHLGGLLATINDLCGTVEKNALSRARVVCSPGPIQGNIIIVQKNGTRELQFEEIDVLVRNEMGELSQGCKGIA